MVAELGDVLEKVLIDSGKLFQRIEAFFFRLYEKIRYFKRRGSGWAE